MRALFPWTCAPGFSNSHLPSSRHRRSGAGASLELKSEPASRVPFPRRSPEPVLSSTSWLSLCFPLRSTRPRRVGSKGPRYGGNTGAASQELPSQEPSQQEPVSNRSPRREPSSLFRGLRIPKCGRVAVAMPIQATITVPRRDGQASTFSMSPQLYFELRSSLLNLAFRTFCHLTPLYLLQ